MKLIHIYKKWFLLFLCTILMCSSAAAQQDSTSKTEVADSIQKDYASKVKRLGQAITQRSIVKFNVEKTAIKQDELIEEIKKLTLRAQVFIKAGIDTVGINNELEQIETIIKVVGDGVFTNKGTAQTYRNLTATSKILSELLNRANARKDLIDKYEKSLVQFRYKIDSLSADTSLYKFPKDSLLAHEYVQKINMVANEINPADTALTYAINNVHKLQKIVNLVAIKLRTQLEEVDNYQEELSANMFSREFANLGADVGYARPFNQIFYFSYIKAKLNFIFYTRNNPGRIFLILLMITMSTIFLRTLQKMIGYKDNADDDSQRLLVLRYPVISAIIMVLNLGQFIFSDPPFIFNCLFWITPAVCLTIVFRRFITRHWMMIWLTFVVLFAITCFDNLILQASRVERWAMLILALAGFIVSILVLIKGRRDELREKLILYFIGLAAFLELASLVANIFGRYNLSKTLLISGYLNVVIGILFLWTIRLINQGLCIASSVYTRQDKKLFYINFDRVGEKAPPLLYILLVLGWFVLFGHNFYVFKEISDPLNDFFFNERTLGNYTFTVNNILVFFLILAVSIVVSKIVSYFASESNTDPVNTGNVRKAGLGSWLLLIRVAIMSTGLFLALAASGFPIQQITVIVGALGLGIGLGLQTLVNNLVSGLIIAFEKPVNVGDIVEIGGQGGTMKSIGFRSSIISKWDGPDMVIPNGDLLNAHLINWTLAGSKRQIEIIVGVAYGTDLQKPQQIIAGLLAENKRIHEHPKPAVLFQNFNNSSIDIKTIFWVRDYKDGAAVKSEIIAAIDVAFKNEGIVIPFPQQELYIHQPPADEAIDTGTGKKEHKK